MHPRDAGLAAQRSVAYKFPFCSRESGLTQRERRWSFRLLREELDVNAHSADNLDVLATLHWTSQGAGLVCRALNNPGGRWKARGHEMKRIGGAVSPPARRIAPLSILLALFPKWPPHCMSARCWESTAPLSRRTTSGPHPLLFAL